jgi:kynurenine formamidase
MMFRRICLLLLAGALVAGCSQGAENSGSASIDLAGFQLVDLSHPYGADALYWPSETSGFELDEQNYGHVEGGYFYASYAFSTPEHGGTHIDAPRHFSETGQTVDQIPLGQLIGPAVVIDVTDQAAGNPDYLLSVTDIEAFERAHGVIAPSSIVLLRTGWSARWPNAKAYLGDDRPGRTDELHFPSFGVEATRLLVQDREVSMIGVDTASIDGGQSHDFMVHQIVGAANVPGLENLMNLEALPQTGAIVFALPMKIGNGSGAPVRVVVLVPKH